MCGDKKIMVHFFLLCTPKNSTLPLILFKKNIFSKFIMFVVVQKIALSCKNTQSKPAPTKVIVRKNVVSLDTWLTFPFCTAGDPSCCPGSFICQPVPLHSAPQRDQTGLCLTSKMSFYVLWIKRLIVILSQEWMSDVSSSGSQQCK